MSRTPHLHPWPRLPFKEINTMYFLGTIVTSVEKLSRHFGLVPSFSPRNLSLSHMCKQKHSSCELPSSVVHQRPVSIKCGNITRVSGDIGSGSRFSIGVRVWADVRLRALCVWVGNYVRDKSSVPPTNLTVHSLSRSAGGPPLHIVDREMHLRRHRSVV